MTQLPGPPILTAKAIAKEVMQGETITIPVIQFSQFLWEADEGRLEFCIEARQQGGGVVLTKWDIGKAPREEGNKTQGRGKFCPINVAILGPLWYDGFR